MASRTLTQHANSPTHRSLGASLKTRMRIDCWIWWGRRKEWFICACIGTHCGHIWPVACVWVSYAHVYMVPVRHGESWKLCWVHDWIPCTRICANEVSGAVADLGLVGPKFEGIFCYRYWDVCMWTTFHCVCLPVNLLNDVLGDFEKRIRGDICGSI